MISAADDDEPFARKEQSNKGVPTKLTPRKDSAMMEKALEWNFDFSYADMAEFLMEIFDFTISRQAIADHLRKAQWNLRSSRVDPALRDDLGHFEKRVDFATVVPRSSKLNLPAREPSADTAGGA